MTRDARPATIQLRMSPQLRDGLRAASAIAGCSMNAFAVQVLATAVGDPSRFRIENAADGSPLPDIKRDALGFPLDGRERMIHLAARSEFIDAMESQSAMPRSEWHKLVKQHDAEDPAFYVEWQRKRQ